ncbi:hypothetical protein [Campylobacter sp. RM12651]|uniref:hypothetical protein n=1 Tax=Campylobacter sp. RM12651 TaxID=1660079 RepID=UPI001EFA6E21|nr:hypothetical protein [Campylobacter sp. RM12651]ULO04597.1 hypothetical protein AVBRAN_a0115 [Campylobacter sp. RM12651]
MSNTDKFFIGAYIKEQCECGDKVFLKNYEQMVDETIFSSIIGKMIELGAIWDLKEELRTIKESFHNKDIIKYTKLCIATTPIEETFKDNEFIVDFLKRANEHLGFKKLKIGEDPQCLFYVSAPKSKLSKKIIDKYRIDNIQKCIRVEIISNDRVEDDLTYDFLRIKEYVKTLKALNFKSIKHRTELIFKKQNRKKIINEYKFELNDEQASDFRRNFKQPDYVGLTGESLIVALDDYEKYNIYIPIDLWENVVKW